MTCCQLKTWKYLTVEKSSPQYKISSVCGEETFDALGEEARNFHLELRRLPVKTTVHLRRLLNLVHLYGREEMLEETDLEEPDPADYDRLIQSEEETDHE